MDKEAPVFVPGLSAKAPGSYTDALLNNLS
jgi:hypothetical protein